MRFNIQSILRVLWTLPFFGVLTHGAKNLIKTAFPAVFSSKLASVSCKTSPTIEIGATHKVKNKKSDVDMLVR